MNGLTNAEPERLFALPDLESLVVEPAARLWGPSRALAEAWVIQNHYMHSVPAAKTYWVGAGEALVAFSIPANQYIGRFLIGRTVECWELSRLWAPDGHAPNLLTWAIAEAVRLLRLAEPTVELLVAYADPNVDHSGHVYRAASWLAAGSSEEGRYYVGSDGVPVARRAFHSGATSLDRGAIERRGFVEERRCGKVRFARGLTRTVRRELRARWGVGDET